MGMLEINENTKKRYFYGWKNQLIRIYFYLQEGLNLINQFKYLVGGILALGYLIKLENYIYLGLMFVGSLPLLILGGYIWVHRAKKSMEWFSLEFTTHFGKYGVELQEKQLEALEQIANKLNKHE